MGDPLSPLIDPISDVMRTAAVLALFVALGVAVLAAAAPLSDPDAVVPEQAGSQLATLFQVLPQWLAGAPD